MEGWGWDEYREPGVPGDLGARAAALACFLSAFASAFSVSVFSSPLTAMGAKAGSVRWCDCRGGGCLHFLTKGMGSRACVRGSCGSRRWRVHGYYLYVGVKWLI